VQYRVPIPLERDSDDTSRNFLIDDEARQDIETPVRGAHRFHAYPSKGMARKRRSTFKRYELGVVRKGRSDLGNAVVD